jgi:hypothetical protein
MEQEEEELSRETVEKNIAALEKVGDFTYREMHPIASNYSPAEVRRLIMANAKAIEVFMYWRDVIRFVIEPDELIAKFDALLSKRLEEAQSVITSLSPYLN